MKKQHPVLFWLLISLAFIGFIGVVTFPFVPIDKDISFSLTMSFLAVLVVSLVSLLVISLVTRTMNPDTKETTTGTTKENDENTTAICPSCGHENPGNSVYCHKCGFPLK